MWPSATCSERGPRPPYPRAPGLLLAAVLALTAVAAAAGRATAQVRMTQAEALASVFGDTAGVERRTAYLSEEQLERARELAGASVDVDASVVTYYAGVRPDGGRAVAYFDAHRVRTLPEVLMIVVDGEGRVDRVEVLKFREPKEYLPPEGWLRQFRGRELAEGLSTRGDIAGITGATLTSRAVTRAVRRTLALHQVISPLSGGDGS